MYQFLCLIGPGVITWMIGSRYTREQVKTAGACFVMVCRIMMYSFINLAVLAAVIRLSEGSLIVLLQDGSVSVRYGVTEVFLSVILSSALGIGISCGRKISIKGIRIDIYKVSCICILMLFCRHLMQGFRWPSDYVLTNHLVSCRFGWLPRSLIGTFGTALFSDSWYKRSTMEFVIVAAALIFIVWFVIECVNCVRCRCFVGMIVFFVFSFSPYASYYLHEMGYFEQYGYAVCVVLLTYVLPECSVRKNRMISAAVGFILLLVSESNMFLIIPIFCAVTFLCIVSDELVFSVKKEMCLLAASYIPHVMYCLFVGVYRFPVSFIQRLQSYDREHVSGFLFREDVHMYFCERSSEENWPRMFHKMPDWCIIYPLLLIVFVSVILYFEKGMKHMICYAVSALGAGICAYSICIVAWDLDRFYFCVFMSVFLLSSFTAKQYLNGIKIRKQYLYMVIGVVFVLACICENRFQLFDGAQYNSGISGFWTTVTGRMVM